MIFILFNINFSQKLKQCYQLKKTIKQKLDTLQMICYILESSHKAEGKEAVMNLVCGILYTVVYFSKLNLIHKLLMSILVRLSKAVICPQGLHRGPVYKSDLYISGW